MRNHPLTVAELIAILQTMPQDMGVQMSMNMEYQGRVCADMVEIYNGRDGGPYVLITDCPGYAADAYNEDEYDGQPDEAQEWHDFDPDC